MTFGKKLKALRKENGVTQEELGRAIGRSNRVISYYENEEYKESVPDDEMLESICKYFSVTEDYFTGEKMKEKNNYDGS